MILMMTKSTKQGSDCKRKQGGKLRSSKKLKGLKAQDISLHIADTLVQLNFNLVLMTMTSVKLGGDCKRKEGTGN